MNWACPPSRSRGMTANRAGMRRSSADVAPDKVEAQVNTSRCAGGRENIPVIDFRAPQGRR